MIQFIILLNIKLFGVSGESVDYKSPAYSLSELGIEGDIVKLAFSRMNTKSYRSSYECKLAILSRLDGVFYINVFGFSTERTNNKTSSSQYICELYTSNQVVGEEEKSTIYRKWKINIGNRTNDNFDGAFKFSKYQSSSNGDIIVLGTGNNTKSENGVYIKGYELYDSLPESSGSEYGYISQYDLFKSSDWVNYIYDFDFHCNNRLLEVRSSQYITLTTYQSLIVLDENMKQLSKQDITKDMGNTYCIKNDGLYAVKENKLYSLITNYVTGGVSITEKATIDKTFDTNAGTCAFSLDDSYLITNGNIYTVDFSTNTVNLIDAQKYYIVKMLTGSNKWISSSNSQYYYTSINFDDKDIVGVQYKGDIYYKQVYPAGVLTAGQPDVRKGKTYLGWMGIPETGTMEVTEE